MCKEYYVNYAIVTERKSIVLFSHKGRLEERDGEKGKECYYTDANVLAYAHLHFARFYKDASILVVDNWYYKEIALAPDGEERVIVASNDEEAIKKFKEMVVALVK